MSNKGKGKNIQNQNYKAADGNMKTFNVIDYSPKTKICIGSDFDIDKNKNDLDAIKADTIKNILTRNPRNAQERFHKYLNIDFKTGSVEWNKEALDNASNELWGDLRNLETTLYNFEVRDKIYNLNILN